MIESTQNKVSYVVTEGQDIYGFPFPFFAPEDIVCYLTRDGKEELLVRGKDYTVENKAGYKDGADITLKVTPFPEEATFTIVRVLSLRQLLNLPEFGKIPSTPVEQNFDKIFMIFQQFQEILDRVLTGEGVSGSAGANFQKYFAEFMADYMLSDAFADAVVRIVSMTVGDPESPLVKRIGQLVDELAKPYKYGLRKLFDVFYAFSVSSPLGAVDLSLGATIDKWTYPEFYAEAIRRANLQAIPVVTESAYLAQLNDTGECPAFVINQAAGTIRLPKVTSSLIPGDPGEMIRAIEEKVADGDKTIITEKNKTQLRLYIQVFSGVLYNDAQTEIDVNSEKIINTVGLGIDVK